MSYRAGPVRSNRRQARQQPYARPARAAHDPAPPTEHAQPRPLSWFGRIKQYLWGAPSAKDPPRMSEPPRLLGNDRPELEPEYDPDAEASQFADIDSDTSTGSRIVHTSQSFISGPEPEPTPAVADGPNEALRQFFETKGDEELSNMEVVGVLSLIGQAVSRNESLIDFSQLSMDQRSDADATASDGSVLKGLRAPPSPQLYRQGTPPPSVRRAVDRSPWSSTPHRRSIRSRYGLAAAPPRRESPTTGPRPARPSGLRNSLARTDAGPGSLSARGELPRVTPAASTILQVLDGEASPKRRVLASQRPSKIPDHETSGDATASGLSFASPAPSSSTPRPSARLPASLLGPKAGSEVGGAVGGAIGASSSTEKLELSAEKPGSISLSWAAKPPASNEPSGAAAPAAALKPLTSLSSEKPAAALFAASAAPAQATAPTPIKSSTGVVDTSIQKDGEVSIDPPAEEDDELDVDFEFEIPVSTAPRELTPAEEAIVAETEAKFTF